MDCDIGHKLGAGLALIDPERLQAGPKPGSMVHDFTGLQDLHLPRPLLFRNVTL